MGIENLQFNLAGLTGVLRSDRYVLRVVENRRLTYFDMSFYAPLDINHDNRPSGSVSKFGTYNPSIGYGSQNRRYVAGSFDLSDFEYDKPITNAQGLIEVINPENWGNTSSIILKDLKNTVTFTADTSLRRGTSTYDSDSKTFKFGIQKCTGTELVNRDRIAYSLHAAILEARKVDGSRLKITPELATAPWLDRNKIFLYQDSLGLNTNLSILTGSAPMSALADITGFSGGKENPDVEIFFRENSSDYVFLKPNHDLEVRSYGLGKRTSDLAAFHDLSLQGSKLDPNATFIGQVRGGASSSGNLSMDPVFYLTAGNNIRFPVQVNNLGSVLGFEYDGVIEPLPLREAALGRTVAEEPFYGFRGALIGSFNYNKFLKSSEEIHNRITYEKTSIVPFYDNNLKITSEFTNILYAGNATDTEDDFAQFIYSFRVPGIILKNDKKIFPFIDTEERIFQALPLNGNNPENDEFDKLVSEVFMLNHIDDDNLGAENFRRRAGFDFSTNPHPGTDSIIFGGFRYV